MKETSLQDTDSQKDAGSDTGTIENDTITESDTTTESDTDTGPVATASWWNCDFRQRRSVAIQPVATIDAGLSLSVVFDHKNFVDKGQSKANGDDVRIVFQEGESHQELPRVLDPLSSWNESDTKIWFGVPSTGLPLGDDAKVYLYYANSKPSKPTANENDVFHFADYFDRTDNVYVGKSWEIYAKGAERIVIRENRLFFEVTGDAINSPVADHAFDPLLKRLRFRFGFDWTSDSDETKYRVHVQLGKWADMEKTPLSSVPEHFSNKGVGPSIVWGGPSQGLSGEEFLGCDVGDNVISLSRVSGFADVQVDVDVDNQQYTIAIDGEDDGVVFPFSQDIDSIDAVRLFTWELLEEKFFNRTFHYIIVEKMGSIIPETAVEFSSSDSAYSDLCGD